MTPVEKTRRDKTDVLIIEDYVGIFQFSKVMGPAYQKIMDYMQSRGEEPQKAPFTQYEVDDWEKTVNMNGFKAFFSMLTKKWPIQMGFEITTDISTNGEIKLKTIPAGDYLKTKHTGPYQKVGDAYKKIYSYAKNQNLKLDNVSYEYYLNDPKKVTKEKLETEIWVPVLS